MTTEAPIAERERRILRTVVEVHIDSGEPVGSKAVATRMVPKLSSASVRAVMNALVQRGILAQPHTSSGRVPTDRGYRLYLEDLVPKRLAADTRDSVEALDWSDGVSATGLLKLAAHLLSAPLGVAGLIAAPRLEGAELMRIDLVWLGPGRALAVAVTRNGLVHERLLALASDVDRETVERFTNVLNSLLPGRTLRDVRRFIEQQLERDRKAYTALEQQALELGRRALDRVDDNDATEVVIDGTARVLANKEFSEAPEQAADLVRSLEQRELWLSLLDHIDAAEDTSVYVGAELGHPALAACSLVIAPYSAGRGAGMVAMIGPKRLDYRRAIPLVGLVASRLSQVIGVFAR